MEESTAATAALAPPPQATSPSEGSPRAVALVAAARGTSSEHHRRGRTSCDRGTSSHVYAPPPQAAAPSAATCGTSSEHQGEELRGGQAAPLQPAAAAPLRSAATISSGTGAAAPGAVAQAHAAHQNQGMRRPSKSSGRKGLGGIACLRVPCIEPHTRLGRWEGGAGRAALCGTACRRAPRHRKPPRHPPATLHGALRHSLPEDTAHTVTHSLVYHTLIPPRPTGARHLHRRAQEASFVIKLARVAERRGAAEAARPRRCHHHRGAKRARHLHRRAHVVTPS